MPFAATLRAGLTAAALAAPALAQPPPTPAPQTPAPRSDGRPWLPVKAMPQAVPPVVPNAPPGPPQYPQPQPAPAPMPARDVPPVPPPPAPALGTADETTSTTTTTTTKRSGGLIVTNNAPNASNQISIGNYGWSASGSGGAAGYPRAARDFATPPVDSGGPALPTSAVGTGYRDRDVPLAQAQRIDLERPGAFRRFAYYLCPKDRFLATPRAAVPTALSIPVQPVVVQVQAAPVAPAASPQYDPAPATLAVPLAPRKHCFPWLSGH